MTTGELHSVEGSNYQAFEPPANQNYVPVPNYVPVQTVPNDGSPSSRLINAKMVRIRISERCAYYNYHKPIFHINTISMIDDLNPQNENEASLFDAEMFVPCCPVPIRYNYIDAQTKQPFGASYYKDLGKQVGCCCGKYFIFPDMIHSKLTEPNNMSTIKCYDSRSFYRTFEYEGRTYYKIGEPYVEPECCQNCCKSEPKPKNECDCCSCCKTPQVVKRIYVDIYNTSNQCVGKYVRFFDITGCCCCQTSTLFFEIYFPPDANEMLKLALIGQMLFILEVGPNIFGVLPGNGTSETFPLGNI